MNTVNTHVNVFKKTDKRIRKITSKLVEKKDGLRKKLNPKGSKKKEGKKCSLYRILKIMVQNKRVDIQ